MTAMTDTGASVTELLIVIYLLRKACRFSTLISVATSLMVAAIREHCPSFHPLFFIFESPSWCVTATAAITILYVSQSCQPSGPWRNTVVSFCLHKSVSHVLRVGDTLPERPCAGCRVQGLSWLSLPVAAVTDVLFNTKAGSSSGWSEYKLAQCLQEGESTASVATIHMQALPFTVGCDGSAVLLLFHTLSLSWNPKGSV